jgi:hypothetical protein
MLKASKTATVADASFSIKHGEDPIKFMTNQTNVLDQSERTNRLQRLVDFNYDLLLNILKKIMAKHAAEERSKIGKETAPTRARVPLEGSALRSCSSCLDEVAEIIKLPKFDQTACDEEEVETPIEVKTQLRSYCEAIARMYLDNAFHNFEHACHVTQSSSKLLSRIVAAKEIGSMEQAYDQTFGIISDPLTQFAVIFSGLIHGRYTYGKSWVFCVA